MITRNGRAAKVLHTKAALTQANGGYHGSGCPSVYHIPFSQSFERSASRHLGHADAVLKGAEAECKALKDEIKRRGLLEATGEYFAIRVAEQISGRLDVAAVKEYLGDSWRRFEVATVSTVIRIKAVTRSRLPLRRSVLTGLPRVTRCGGRGLFPRSSNPTRFEMSDKLDRRTMLTAPRLPQC